MEAEEAYLKVIAKKMEAELRQKAVEDAGKLVAAAEAAGLAVGEGAIPVEGIPPLLPETIDGGLNYHTDDNVAVQSVGAGVASAPVESSVSAVAVAEVVESNGASGARARTGTERKDAKGRVVKDKVLKSANPDQTTLFFSDQAVEQAFVNSAAAVVGQAASRRPGSFDAYCAS